MPEICAAGATVVLLAQFEARTGFQAISRHRSTWFIALPPFIATMLCEREALRGVRLRPVSPDQAGGRRQADSDIRGPVSGDAAETASPPSPVDAP